MSTLGEMKARGERIVLYCQGNVGARWCSRSVKPSMDQLIQYFGVDYDVAANRALFLSRFVCEACGSRMASLQIDRPSRDPNHNGGIPGAYHVEYVSVEEATRRHHEFTAELRRLGIKTNAEINAEARASLKVLKAAEKGSGEFFIGPPDPRKYRKRG